MSVLKLSALAAVLSSIAAFGAHADPALFVAEWHWNKVQSSSVAGEPAPQAVTLNITELSGGKLKWTMTETDPKGTKRTESFNGRSDGTASPVKGADQHTTAAFTVSGDSLSAVFKSKGGASDNWACNVTTDGRTMTCKGTQGDGEGHNADYTDVYDRG